MPKHELLWVKRPEKRRPLSSVEKCKTLSLMRLYLSFVDVVDALLNYFREEIDEETQEWERAQIKRSGLKPDEESSIPATTHLYRPTPSTWAYGFWFWGAILIQN